MLESKKKKKKKIKEYTEEEYQEFFDWLLEKKVHLNKEVDITLLNTYKNPYSYYPDEIKRLLETESMQRLGRITQLGTGILSNPTNYHTRLGHSKGAGNNAIKFYMNQFQNEKWRQRTEEKGRKQEVLADIIQMFTHDIGHNVLSHALEKLIASHNLKEDDHGAAHEILGRRIVNEDPEIREVLDSIHPELLHTLNQVSGEDYDLKNLKDGSIDFDRLDFMVRDLIYLGQEGDRKTTDRILQNCMITEVKRNGNMCQVPFFRSEVFEDVQHFLEYRAMTYKTEYTSNRRIAYDNLARYFCARLVNSDYDCELKTYLGHCMEKGGDGIDLEEFKKWDDIRYYNTLIQIAQECPDEDLKELAYDCLPNLEGLTNIVYECLQWTDETIDNLPDYQREFFENVKYLVKNKSPLQERLLAKKGPELIWLDTDSAEEVEKVLTELERAGIPKEKLESMISWKKEIIKYDDSEPIFFKSPMRNGIWIKRVYRL